MADAASSLVRQLPARFETAEVTAASLAALAVHGLPLDEFATRPARILAVTREDVRRVARERFDERMLAIVVVGDAGVVRAGLEKLAKERGIGLDAGPRR
jgi:predicted Zn-dependent peptidase